MGGIRKFRPGDRIEAFPVKSWNEMADVVEGVKRQLSTIADTRKPKEKSPVIVRLAWTGEDAVEPGQCVKLTEALIDPAENESAPYMGLAFYSEPFDENEDLVDYAITMGPIAARITRPGTLTTRSDDDDGVVTLDDDEHGIRSGDHVDLEWIDPDDATKKLRRLGMVVGELAGDEEEEDDDLTIPLTGGRGEVLPDADTDVTVIRKTTVSYGVMPECYWAQLHLTDDEHTHAKIVTAGTLLESAASGGLRIVWKPALEPAEMPEDPPPPADVWCIVNMGGGIGDHYQLLRGSAPEDVLPSTEWFQVTSGVALEEFAATPTFPVKIANAPRVFMSQGASFIAAYRQGAATLGELEYTATLDVRSDDDTGTIGVIDDPHEIRIGRTLTVTWSGGERTGVAVTAVSGQDVGIDGGTGDALPSETTSLDITVAEESVDWELIFVERLYRSEFFMLLGDPVPAGTSTDPGILWPATPGIYYYTPDGYVQITVEQLFGTDGDVGIYNPFPYIAHGTSDGAKGFYPVEFQHTSTDGETLTYWFSLTGYDATGFDGWVLGSDQILVHPAGQMPEWTDYDSGGTTVTFPPFDPSSLEADIAALYEASVEPGYAIDITDEAGPDLVHLDPTEITGHAAEWQFFMHLEGESTDREDAHWETVDDYDDAEDQLPGHESGSWVFKVIGDWLKKLIGWNSAIGEWLVHKPLEDPEWHTPAEALKLVADWDSGSAQSIVHSASGDPHWGTSSGSGVAALGVVTEGGGIDGRSGSSPGSGAVSIIKSNGSPSTTWENWSTVSIPEDYYCLAIEIDGDMVITDAWCE